MSDQMNAPTTPTVEQRLAGVVDSIKQRIANAPKFRPSDPELAKAYDAEISSLLDTLENATAACAVDERALIFAKDRSDARNARMLTEQKMRGDFDTALMNSAAAFSAPFLTAASGKNS